MCIKLRLILSISHLCTEYMSEQKCIFDDHMVYGHTEALNMRFVLRLYTGMRLLLAAVDTYMSIERIC